jgi:hypothetical protein
MDGHPDRVGGGNGGVGGGRGRHTEVQGPRGEIKPLRPAFLYCTAKPREAYKVLVTELLLAGGRRTYLA